MRGKEIDQLIERMRINVPSSIRESEQTLAERDRILADAHTEAERIVVEAQQRARELISERSLLDAANRERDRIVRDGMNEAHRRVEEANLYAIGALNELREHLKSLSAQVDNGINVMESHTEKAKPSVPVVD